MDPVNPVNQDLPPIETRWGDLTDEQRTRLPEGTVLGPPPRQPWWGVLIRHSDGWRDANGNIVSVPALHRPILVYPTPPDPRPSTVTIRLTPALYARALAAGMPEGERAIAVGEWLVSRAEATPVRPVLAEIHAERVRQDAKWGEQNHPDGTGPGALEDLSHRCTSADAAKGQCDRAFRTGAGTYAHILYEEIAEAFEERDPARLRAELIQVAAVAVAWVEKIDRDIRSLTAEKEAP